MVIDPMPKDEEELEVTHWPASPWVAEHDEKGRYVWHYCISCGIAMNQLDQHKPGCRYGETIDD